jgi:hypothetical protein
MLRKILLPFIRFCVRRSIRLQELLPVIKECFIEVASQELARSGNPITAAKLSAMTGVHRKDIKEVNEHLRVPGLVRHPVVRAISLWRSSPEFTDQEGNPRLLTFDTPQSEFHALASKLNSDISPYSLLFELERSGSILKTPEGLQLISSGYLTITDGWELFAEEVDDLLATMEHNLSEEGHPKNLQLKTSFDAIPSTYAEEIRSWLRKRGADFQREVAAYLAAHDCDIDSANKAKLRHDTDFLQVSCSAFALIRTAEPDDSLKKPNLLTKKTRTP